jgi:hypothetical protein
MNSGLMPSGVVLFRKSVCFLLVANEGEGVATSLVMPSKETPAGVTATLIGLAILGAVLLVWLLNFWGIILLFGILGVTTGTYTRTVPGFHALVLLNHFSGNQRAVFQGMNFTLPWESATQEIDLRVDLKEVCEESYASQDALMNAKYVYTVRPDVSGSNPGENVILYASYETDAIRQSARALFSMLLSDHFGKNSGPALLDKDFINKETFQHDPGRSLIAEFERDHAVKVTVRLENSNFSPKTQEARDSMSRASSFSNAVQRLIDGGMSRSEAEKVAKLMNLPGVKEYLFNVHAPDFRRS